jgi:SAM-dependent methyltransferase
VDRAGGSYLFTDVSELFLTRASERFGEFGSLQLALLDVQEDPTRQGFAAGTFDLIVAANVVHATSDIRRSLERLRALLSPGGILLLIEVTAYLDWFDVSTALLEGWDLQDDEVRSDHPMLSSELWTELLNAAGFASVAAFPSAGSPAEVMAQHVIVGMAPGDPAFRRSPGETRGSVMPEQHGTPSGGAGLESAEARVRSAEDFTRRIEAASPREREELLVAYVREHVAALLRLSEPSRIEREGRLMDLGLDSLLAVELRGRLATGIELPQELPSTLAFDFPTVRAIASMISGMFGGADAGPYTPASDADGVAVETPVADTLLDHLSDAEVEDRLLARLRAMEGPTP